MVLTDPIGFAVLMKVLVVVADPIGFAVLMKVLVVVADSIVCVALLSALGISQIVIASMCKVPFLKSSKGRVG